MANITAENLFLYAAEEAAAVCFVDSLRIERVRLVHCLGYRPLHLTLFCVLQYYRSDEGGYRSFGFSVLSNGKDQLVFCGEVRLTLLNTIFPQDRESAFRQGTLRIVPSTRQKTDDGPVLPNWDPAFDSYRLISRICKIVFVIQDK